MLTGTFIVICYPYVLYNLHQLIPFLLKKILVAENHVPTTNNESLFTLKFHNILRISR